MAARKRAPGKGRVRPADDLDLSLIAGLEAASPNGKSADPGLLVLRNSKPESAEDEEKVEKEPETLGAWCAEPCVPNQRSKHPTTVRVAPSVTEFFRSDKPEDVAKLSGILSRAQLTEPTVVVMKMTENFYEGVYYYSVTHAPIQFRNIIPKQRNRKS